MLRPNILILGAGFGGMYVARKLRPFVKKGLIDVTIINETNYFLFTPLLHEVATGALAPSSVAEPLREIFVGTEIRFLQGAVQSIDLSKRIVHIASEIHSKTNNRRTIHDISYDYLVIATGSVTNYYDIPGAEAHSYPLKNLRDASRIRERIIDSFEEAMLCDDQVTCARLLSFTVIGGGATGVEMAAELAELVRGMSKRYYSKASTLSPDIPMVGLVHSGDELLQQFHPRLRTSVAMKLHNEGVNLHLGNTVTSVTPQGLTLSNNTTISTSTVIWCAGVKGNIPNFEGDIPMTKSGRISVDEYQRIHGDERVFTLGDMTGTLPMLAQVATQQALVVAQNIIASIRQKKLKTFEYHSKGSMVSVGQWYAIGQIYSMKFSGKFTWWMWRTVYLFKFISWKKRIRIAIDWTFDIFSPRDITKL